MLVQDYLKYKDYDYDENEREWDLTTGRGFKEILVRLHGTGSTPDEDELRTAIEQISLEYKSSTICSMAGRFARKRKAIISKTQPSLIANDGEYSEVVFPVTLTPTNPLTDRRGLQVESREPFYLEIDWDDDNVTNNLTNPQVDIVERRVRQIQNPRFSYLVREREFTETDGEIYDDINIVNQPFRAIFLNVETFEDNETAKFQIGFDDLRNIIEEETLAGLFYGMLENRDLDSNAKTELQSLNDNEIFAMVDLDGLNPKAKNLPSFDYRLERNSDTAVSFYKEQLRRSDGVE